MTILLNIMNLFVCCLLTTAKKERGRERERERKRGREKEGKREREREGERRREREGEKDKHGKIT